MEESLLNNENYKKFMGVCKPLSLRNIWKKWYDYTHNDNIIHEGGIRVIRVVDFVKEVQLESPIQFEKLAIMCNLQITPYLVFDKVDDIFSVDIEETGHLKYYITPVPNFSPTIKMVNSGTFGYTETHDPYVYCNDNLPNLFDPPQDIRKELPLVCGWTVSILENKWREPDYTWSSEALKARDLKNSKLLELIELFKKKMEEELETTTDRRKELELRELIEECNGWECDFAYIYED